jgi:hypothetical protein
MSVMTYAQADTIMRCCNDPHKWQKLLDDMTSPALAQVRATCRRNIEQLQSQIEHLRQIVGPDESASLETAARHPEDYDEAYEGHRR